MIASTFTISVSNVTTNFQADMADADKQKEMDAKKAEVEDLFILIILITIIIIVAIKNFIINAAMVAIINAITILTRLWPVR